MASRTRAATTRRARYGTVVNPTIVASRRAAEARITVVQTLPDSRATVEKRAAVKASIKPTIATKNRTHTWEMPMEGRLRVPDGWFAALAINGFPRAGIPAASSQSLSFGPGRRRLQFSGNVSGLL